MVLQGLVFMYLNIQVLWWSLSKILIIYPMDHSTPHMLILTLALPLHFSPMFNMSSRLPTSAHKPICLKNKIKIYVKVMNNVSNDKITKWYFGNKSLSGNFYFSINLYLAIKILKTMASPYLSHIWIVTVALHQLSTPVPSKYLQKGGGRERGISGFKWSYQGNRKGDVLREGREKYTRRVSGK